MPPINPEFHPLLWEARSSRRPGADGDWERCEVWGFVTHSHREGKVLLLKPLQNPKLLTPSTLTNPYEVQGTNNKLKVDDGVKAEASLGSCSQTAALPSAKAYISVCQDRVQLG